MDIGKGILIYLSGRLLWALGERAREYLKSFFGRIPAYYCLFCGKRLAYAPEFLRWYCPSCNSWY
ncbi:hypothetical protein MUP79_08395 [Candidatus Bathyarchaeota archaeon]|nr:hypothetical protein [Candidatus Bathyarchaeota archaeon]